MATTGVVCFSRDSDSGSAKITTSHDLSSGTHLGSVRDLVTLWLAGWLERGMAESKVICVRVYVCY